MPHRLAHLNGMVSANERADTPRRHWLLMNNWCISIQLHSGLLVGALLFVLPAFPASSDILSSQEIAAYQVRVKTARAAQEVLSSELECLVSRVAELAARRDADDLRLGETRSREHDLREKVTSGKAECQAASDELQLAEYELEEQRNVLLRLQAMRDAQQRELDECKGHAWIPDAACELAYDIAHWVGAYEETEDHIRSLHRQVQHRSEAAWQSRNILELSQEHLEQVSAELNSLQAKIHNIESEISVHRIELSSVRTHEQAHREMLDVFADALAQAADTGSESNRARMAQRVRDVASRFDATQAQLASAIARAGDVLPAQSTTCIRR